MARSTYFDRSRIADACPGSESGYAQRFQCGNIVKRLIWTRMDKTRIFVTCDEAEGAKFRTLGLAKKVVRWILGGCTVCGHWEIKTEIPDEF